ncbi:MAG: hypothetical protein ACP5D5_10050 [Acidithiobacillus sp.]|uniref:hypothetical protein n=1 Tax=Acidithiobacillus sp. TaxID=1872118 RepID=UPI003D028B38
MDLDTYNSEWRGHSPERIADAVLFNCDTDGYPRPSLILTSGRGLYLKWFHDPLPRPGLPRWSAIERHLVQAFADFGADAKAKDVSRVLRILGTKNSKNGATVRVLHVEADDQGQPVRYGFDYLAECFLPKSREEIAKQRIERAARRAEYQRRQEERLRTGKAGNLRMLSPGQLNWDRLGDLQKLAEMRKGPHGLPDGQREPMLFWQLNFMLLSTAIEPSQLWFEAQALAHNLGVTDYQSRELSTLYAKAKAYRQGETVEWNGRRMPPLYTPRNQTLIDWLQITPDEERQLQTIVSEGEARRRARERDQQRKEQERRAAGRKRQSTPEMRQKARLLLEQGKSLREAAQALGVSHEIVRRWCR